MKRRAYSSASVDISALKTGWDIAQRERPYASPPRVYRTARRQRGALVFGLGILVAAHLAFVLAALMAFQAPSYEQQQADTFVGLWVLGFWCGYVTSLISFPMWLFRVWRNLYDLGVKRPRPWRLWAALAWPEDAERPHNGTCWAPGWAGPSSSPARWAWQRSERRPRSTGCGHTRTSCRRRLRLCPFGRYRSSPSVSRIAWRPGASPRVCDPAPA